LRRVEKMQDLYDKWKEFDTQQEKDEYLNCRNYRQSTTPYLKFIKKHQSAFILSLDSSLYQQWSVFNSLVGAVCR